MARLSKELENAAKEVDAFDASVAALTKDECAKAPLLETEPQTKQ